MGKKFADLDRYARSVNHNKGCITSRSRVSWSLVSATCWYTPVDAEVVAEDVRQAAERMLPAACKALRVWNPGIRLVWFAPETEEERTERIRWRDEQLPPDMRGRDNIPDALLESSAMLALLNREIECGEPVRIESEEEQLRGYFLARYPDLVFVSASETRSIVQAASTVARECFHLAQHARQVASLIRIERVTGRKPDLRMIYEGQAEAFAYYAVANVDWYPEQWNPAEPRG